MRGILKIAGVGCLVVLLAIVAGIYALYRASQHVPEFYRQALQADRAAQSKASDRMIQHATALANDVRKEGRWEAVFTAEEINGWLAVDLVKNHPGALPASIRDPRVVIEPEQVMVACRFEEGKISGVVMLAVEPYLQEPNVLALRIRKARAGLLPLPLNDFLDLATKAAARAEIDLHWRQADGDPVAIFRIPPPRDVKNRVVSIDTIRLSAGQISLAGSTERKK